MSVKAIFSTATLLTIVWCTLSGSVTLWIIPVAVLVIALYLWTPKTGKEGTIYGVLVLAMLIVYFASRG